MKKKMDTLTKMKLIYTIELAVIAIAVTVIAILELTCVIRIKDTIITIFNWVTLFGGAFLVFDFFWTLLSPKKRAKNSLLDKCLTLPLGIYLMTFDLIALIGGFDKTTQYDFYKYGISAALLYIGVIYTIQAIYHWWHPLPGLIEDANASYEEEKAKLEQKEEPSKEETPAVEEKPAEEQPEEKVEEPKE